MLIELGRGFGPALALVAVMTGLGAAALVLPSWLGMQGVSLALSGDVEPSVANVLAVLFGLASGAIGVGLAVYLSLGWSLSLFVLREEASGLRGALRRSRELMAGRYRSGLALFGGCLSFFMLINAGLWCVAPGQSFEQMSAAELSQLWRLISERQMWSQLGKGISECWRCGILIWEQ